MIDAALSRALSRIVLSLGILAIFSRISVFAVFAEAVNVSFFDGVPRVYVQFSGLSN